MKYISILLVLVLFSTVVIAQDVIMDLDNRITDDSVNTNAQIRAGVQAADEPTDTDDYMKRLAQINKDRLRVLADQNEQALRRLAKLNDANLEKLAKLDRARIARLSNLTNDEIEARLRSMHIVQADDDYRKRPLDIAILRASHQARERLLENKEKIEARYEARIRNVTTIKNRLKECDNSEECSVLRQEAFEHSKQAALSVVERLENHLNLLKERIEAAEDLEGQTAMERIAVIDSILEELDRIKNQIDAAQTKEELNDAVQKLRRIVNAVKDHTLNDSNRLIRALVTGRLHRIEVVEKNIDCSLGKTEISSPEIEALEVEYTALMQQARDKVVQAKDVFDADNPETFEQAKELAKEARDLVKQAHEKLVEIRRIIVEAGGTICTLAQPIVIEDEKEQELELELEYENEKNETKTAYSVGGTTELTAEAQGTLEVLVSTFENVEGKFELKIKAKKDGNETSVEEEIKGDLSSSQEELWRALKEMVEAILNSEDGDDLEIEIEIEHEMEVQ